MKKVFFVFSVAALALTACTNESIEYVGDAGQPKEIAFAPVAQPTTRGSETQQYAIDGADFPTALNMKVAAYQVSPTATNYFASTSFVHGGSYWGGSTARFWPLSAAYINFLAYANVTGSAAFDATNYASGAVITQTDNSSAQTDLMYAIGYGEVKQSGNELSFPAYVPMVFKHAQAWISFNVKGSNITINSITLNGAKYAGTYTITHTNFNQNSSQNVAGAWTLLGDAKDVAVPGISSQALTGSPTSAGRGLMIVPDDAATGDFTSFTINYTHDGKTYDYTFTPANTNVEQGKHYIYDITFTLHEILIHATITDWEDQSINYVDIPAQSFAYVASTGETGTFTLPSATAGTYSCTITGLPADTYTVEEKTDEGTDFISAVNPSTSVTLGTGDPLNISFTVSASSGDTRKIVIKNDDATPVTLFTLTVAQP